MSWPVIPRFVWWVIWAVVILIVLALLRFNLAIGAGGIHITQNLVN